MKLLNYFLIPLILIAIFIASCSDDTITTNGNNVNVIDPTITITDQFGNVLGGDTTDWCMNGGSGVPFYASYPNPTNDTFNVHLYIAQEDTLSLYFLNTSTDTLYLFKDNVMAPGFHDIMLRGSSLSFSNIIKRLYMEVKVHPNNSPYCRYYGDVQFY